MNRIDQIFSSPTSTFRDPQGKLYQDGNRILREIYPQHKESVLSWIRSPLAQRWIEQRRLVPTDVLVTEADQPALLEHEQIFFPSYPWEWSPDQWICAGSLTLDLCEEALDSGYILKDATPLNMLFSGPQPIFVDVLSFDKRDPKSPLWIAYAQFVRTFLLPLAAYVHLGWPLAATQQRRDGYEPADLAPWLHFVQRWRRPLRSLVTLPMLFEKDYFEKKSRLRTYRPEVSEELSAHDPAPYSSQDAQIAQFSFSPAHSSRWSRYTETGCHYKPEDHAAKQEFVRRSLGQIKPVHVLDVGANTGVYSRIAAESGANVVAWDTDVRATGPSLADLHIATNYRFFPWLRTSHVLPLPLAGRMVNAPVFSPEPKADSIAS